MSIEVVNETDVEVDVDALAAQARFTLDRLRIHPQAELSVVLVDEAAMTDLHIVFALFPRITQLDFTGPYEVFWRLPGAQCVMASVKTNLGHLEAAAGITGLIKAALCVQRGIAPPHLNAARPNPKIALDELGLVLPQVATALMARNGQRIAGVNSFGYGGTNAHVVVEEAPSVEASSPSRSWQLGPGDLFAVSSRIEMQGHRAETGLTRCYVRRGELYVADSNNARIQILEVFHMCLLMGFQGKYIIEGSEKLSYLTSRLGDEIAHFKGTRAAFAPHWAPPDKIRNKLRNEVPLWVLGSVFGLLGLLAFTGLRWQLGRATEADLAPYQDVVKLAPPVAHVTITLP